MKKIVLGFSGGVDSSVAAKLLTEDGYEVYGLYLDNGNKDARISAEETAKAMGLPLEIRDIRDMLNQKVCEPFAKAYQSGLTPIPCIICNPGVKFHCLLEYADSMEIPFIATGHYAASDGIGIFQGHPDNDQSYMLCRLTREQAGRTVFPLAPYSKKEVRSLAEKYGLLSAKKPDSQEICFIPGNDYREWLRQRGVPSLPGRFMFHGEDFGEHTGIIHYTVGQRLPGFYNGRKLYISRINAADNTITLALWEELFFTEVQASSFNWLIDTPTESFRASVRVRHTRWETPDCTVYPENSCVRIVCDSPVRAPAPGQSAVLYQGTRLLGGGFIK